MTFSFRNSLFLSFLLCPYACWMGWRLVAWRGGVCAAQTFAAVFPEASAEDFALILELHAHCNCNCTAGPRLSAEERRERATHYSHRVCPPQRQRPPLFAPLLLRRAKLLAAPGGGGVARALTPKKGLSGLSGLAEAVGIGVGSLSASVKAAHGAKITAVKQKFAKMFKRT